MHLSTIKMIVVRLCQHPQQKLSSWHIRKPFHCGLAIIINKQKSNVSPLAVDFRRSFAFCKAYAIDLGHVIVMLTLLNCIIILYNPSCIFRYLSPSTVASPPIEKADDRSSRSVPRRWLAVQIRWPLQHCTDGWMMILFNIPATS